MIYLGGQHLKQQQQAPQKISDNVYRVFNSNRTHAFALRGRAMQAAYRHLSRRPWSGAPHHIDHQLGLFHQKQFRLAADGEAHHAVYCPGEWLVGQSAGTSRISNRTRHNTQYWSAAEQIAPPVDPSELPFVAILGLHSSGSSCVAGVCYHLGLHLGNKLGGFYGNQPKQGQCGYEAIGLASICEQSAPFPATKIKQTNWNIWRQLRDWINPRIVEAYDRRTVAGGKYPQLCRFGNQLLSICRQRLHVVNVERPIEESIASMVRRTQGHIDPAAVEAHQRWLMEGKEEILDKLPDERVITVPYPALLDDPQAQVGRLAEFLERVGIPPHESRTSRAIQHVRPQDRHVDLATL